MNLTRRSLLKGVSLGAGATLLSPVVQHLSAQAAGARAMPKRVVFVLEGNGTTPDQVQPKGLPRRRERDRTSQINVPLAKYELPFALEPLKPYKDRLTILQGLSGRVCGGGHSNNYGALGVYSSKKGAYGETIDVALAKALPSIFGLVNLGMVDGKKDGQSIVYNTSARGPGQAVPTITSPTLAYNTLFGSVAKGAGGQEFAAKNNLLDFMAEDVRRLESALSGEERKKLSSYLEAFESMRHRQSRLNEIESTLRKHGPAVSDKYTSAVETDRLDAMFDMGAAALVCGLTSVLTISSGSGDPYFGVRFTGLGINLGKHGIGHGGSFNGKTWYELSSTIRRFHMELIARLAKKLESVKEGDGTMLDNTLIVYTSDAAEAHHSRCWEWPFVLLGDLGGRLKSKGRYIEYPRYGQKGHRTVGNLYATFLHAAGKPRDTFGVADAGLKGLDVKGPLGEVLA